MLHPSEPSPSLLARAHFPPMSLFVCVLVTYHFSQGRDDFPQSGQGLVDVCSFLVRRGKAQMLRPHFRATLKPMRK